ncbi:MAG: dienelactone hydrolase family protein [Deltaproteobacteria bacterium]|nr:dienelactone hydrolase family protein [Deltaproteobacteria bacterium]
MPPINTRLKYCFLIFLIAVLPGALLAKNPPIETREIAYKAGDKTMTGYLAMPKAAKKGTPAVLVVHEWWGQTDYPRKRARMLAELGYIAMAVDMYGDRQITGHPKQAAAFRTEVFSSAKNVRNRFDAAMEALLKNSPAKAGKIVAIGYCFGGSVVLEMARQGVDIAGVASFHGGLDTPTKAVKSNVKAKVLVLHGAADPMTQPEDIQAFHKEMKSAGVDYRFIAYEGAKHGFTNPDADFYAKKLNFKALGYQEKADLASWSELGSFIKGLF